jgi:23S rRNA (adenine2503-C2)-methyltransferase
VFYDFNDTLDDARELLKFTRKVPSKVNLIEYNPIEEADFVNTQEDRLSRFASFLEQNNVNVRIRRSRGKDIDAACGQLANRAKM